MNIFLIGYMASGKTTFGKALARKLGRTFIDLDNYIEESTGDSVTQLFKKYGHDGFRKIESEKLREIGNLDNLIVACGGGTPCFHNNISFLNNSGLTVFLETSEHVLTSRLAEDNQNRPLVAGKSYAEIQETIKSQLEERLPFYRQAALIWDGNKLENEKEINENVSAFIDFLKRF
ncbi:MAG: shikimate kinase [Muribaculaceae bacterium]|nr:shikimate kinase [Muribaculaceae bacterium]